MCSDHIISHLTSPSHQVRIKLKRKPVNQKKTILLFKHFKKHSPSNHTYQAGTSSVGDFAFTPPAFAREGTMKD